jgi:rRNA pseudouridine-1189 N-methylase Emg1 (Nep1/Mra1 family)
MSSEVPPQRLSTYLTTLPTDKPIVFFIGAMAHGHDDWVDDIVDAKVLTFNADFNLGLSPFGRSNMRETNFVR